MPGIAFTPWEPEESVGRLWHDVATRFDAPATHDDAAVDLSAVEARLAVLFRGLGGAASVAIRAAAPEPSRHRLSRRRRLGTESERLHRASFDGASLRLPPRMAVFPSRDANTALYLWLAAMLAHAAAEPPPPDTDPLRADLRALALADRLTRATLVACPGLRSVHTTLAAHSLRQRPRHALPPFERAVEAVIAHRLGAPAPTAPLARRMTEAVTTDGSDLSAFSAPRGYRPARPVPLWPDLRPFVTGDGTPADSDTASAGPPPDTAETTHRARRRRADRPQRRDSLILHRFEAILSFAAFLNVNRRVEDDDPDGARKAADDLDEVTLTQTGQAPATRLRLHLDLAPEEAERARLSAPVTYPEWDARRGVYLPDHVRVLDSPAEPAVALPPPDPRAARRIRMVQRRFEALRPRRVLLPAQPDGADLDLDAVVRARADLAATGEESDRVWRAARQEARDLAVSILLDVSRSTESVVAGRPIIEIEREALTALAWGVTAAGDACAISAFSSRRRHHVFLSRVKDFTEPMGAAVEARIAGLAPGHYTRLGAAIRHVAAGLGRQPQARRLLLIITDGKPNDIDHYEGRHGIEDSRMAVREARRQGHAVFGITVDTEGQRWFPRLFGRGGYAVIREADRLTTALPDLYRHLVVS